MTAILSGRALATAVAAGALLAVTHGHVPSLGSLSGLALTSADSNVALGQQMAARYGWTGSQWTCLDELWTRESSWSSTAANPTSDARGIAQNINGWSGSYQYGNAGQQIGWGLNYVQGRYGTPCGAWDHETTDGWY